MVIGVAGKYCAGKDAVVSLFIAEGYEEINLDRIGHEALSVKAGEIEEKFGKAVVGQNGGIDRKALGALVFSNREALTALEAILHPWMVQETKNRLAGGGRKWVINAALLFHMGLDSLCDLAIWVTAPLTIRIKRGMKRDSLDIMAIIKRIWAQRHLRPQNSRNFVDIYRVVNRGTKEILEKKIGTLMKAKGL